MQTGCENDPLQQSRLGTACQGSSCVEEAVWGGRKTSSHAWAGSVSVAAWAERAGTQAVDQSK